MTREQPDDRHAVGGVLPDTGLPDAHELARGVSRIARPLALLIAVTAIFTASGITNHELWTGDEPRVAAIGREMSVTGAWALPRLAGVPFMEKPPLYWWAQALVFRLAGRADAGLARIPSAIFSMLSVLLTYAIGRRFFPAPTSLLGCGVLLTLALFTKVSHWILVDNALLFGTTSTLACFVWALDARGPRRWLLLTGMYASVCVAFLAKGAVGVAIPGLGVGCYLIWTRQLRRFLGWHLALGALGVSAVIGLWLAAVWRDSGMEAMQTFLVNNQLGRLLPGVIDYRVGHVRPWSYYLSSLPGNTLPWTPLILLAAVAGFRRPPRLAGQDANAARFLLSTSLPIVLALSFAGTKRGIYLLPVMPSLALLTGAWLARSPDGEAPWIARFERIWRTVVIVLGAASPILVLGIMLFLIEPAHWLWAVLAEIPCVAAAVWALRSGRARDPADRWLAAMLPALLGVLFILVFALPEVDRYKSFTPWTDVIRERVPEGATVYTVGGDETLIGVVHFYTARPVHILESSETLLDLARSPGTHWLALRERFDPPMTEQERLSAAGVPVQLMAERVVGDRIVRLLAFGTEPGGPLS